MNIKETILEMDEQLDDFENKLGLSNNVTPGDASELENYLKMDASVLSKLSAESCAEISIRLIQFSVYIQRCINKDKSRIISLENILNKTVANNINQYTGSWEMTYQQAINGNDYASNLQSSIIKIKQRMSRLDFISTGLKNLADQLKNIQFVKLREEKYGQ